MSIILLLIVLVLIILFTYRIVEGYQDTPCPASLSIAGTGLLPPPNTNGCPFGVTDGQQHQSEPYTMVPSSTRWAAYDDGRNVAIPLGPTSTMTYCTLDYPGMSLEQDPTGVYVVLGGNTDQSRCKGYPASLSETGSLRCQIDDNDKFGRILSNSGITSRSDNVYSYSSTPRSTSTGSPSGFMRSTSTRVVGGIDVDGAPLYVCGVNENGYQLGKTKDGWGYCKYPYGGGDGTQGAYRSSTSYEYMSDTSALWFHPSNGVSITNNAKQTLIGKDVDGTTLYSCRVWFYDDNTKKWSLQVGKTQASWGYCQFEFNGTSYQRGNGYNFDVI